MKFHRYDTDTVANNRSLQVLRILRSGVTMAKLARDLNVSTSWIKTIRDHGFRVEAHRNERREKFGDDWFNQLVKMRIASENHYKLREILRNLRAITLAETRMDFNASSIDP